MCGHSVQPQQDQLATDTTFMKPYNCSQDGVHYVMNVERCQIGHKPQS